MSESTAQSTLVAKRDAEEQTEGRVNKKLRAVETEEEEDVEEECVECVENLRGALGDLIRSLTARAQVAEKSRNPAIMAELTETLLGIIHEGA
jgi:hypothetical protein